MARDMLEMPHTVTEPVAPELPFLHIMPTDAPEIKALKFGYSVIVDKCNWCTQTAARNKDGEPVGISNAVQFCAYGAMVYAERVLALKSGTAVRAIKMKIRLPFRVFTEVVNDALGHRVTLWVMKRAILRG